MRQTPTYTFTYVPTGHYLLNYLQHKDAGVAWYFYLILHPPFLSKLGRHYPPTTCKSR